MTADREPNRLPLRAGAMLLFAVAVVFIGLGWHSAATAGNDPEDALEAAARSAAASSSASAPTTTETVGDLRVCVINAGFVDGLAGEITDQLDELGYETAAASNISGGFTENTILYDDPDGQRQAEQIAEQIDDAVVEERPTGFTNCRGGIPVVMVTQ